MQETVTELKEMDDLLFDEFREVSEFESELFNLEYELDEEAKLVAKLHNACHKTTSTIKHLHSLIRRIHQSAEDKTIPVFRNMIKRQLDALKIEISAIMNDLRELENDEAAGKKILKYCEKIEAILNKKVATLEERFKDLEDI